MPQKLAIDWDDSELRLVVANCSGSSIQITDAAVIPLDERGIEEALPAAVAQRGLERTQTLVVIGRGRAELRELKLPPVPDEELPDMVRFQAIRNFASAGDAATVDFLVTHRAADGVEMIAAAVGPSGLNQTIETCTAAGLEVARIALRPLAAAALYLERRGNHDHGDTVLIDLLANDAEIVVTRAGDVAYVRTVRMPTDSQSRGAALAGELRRSLVACGSHGSIRRVILWGRGEVHVADQAMLTEASNSPVEMLDPFELVEVSRHAKSRLPEHVGRLAPLVGLLAADETAPDRLIDFLKPRQRPELQSRPYRTALRIGVLLAIAACGLLLLYRQLAALDARIDQVQSANAAMRDRVERAAESINRTAGVDSYLDGDVNWLSELTRLARRMPPADDLIVRRITGRIDDRRGGGMMTIVGGVQQPEVIREFEQSLRDDFHQVMGDGASEIQSDDKYRWAFTERISILPDAIRQQRYRALGQPLLPLSEPDSERPPTESSPVASPPPGSPDLSAPGAAAP